MTNTELQSHREAHVPLGFGIQTAVYAARGQNAEVWDVGGQCFIDLAAGIAVCNTGHRHAAVVDAVRNQLDQFSRACFRVAPYDGYVRFTAGPCWQWR